MLPAEITQKALREGNTFYCGYCEIDDVVRYLPEVGFNYGVYGWNCTAYCCGRFILVTGYRPAGWKRLTREECERLNAAARHGADIPDAVRVAALIGMTPEAVNVMAELTLINRERCEREANG